MLKSALIDAIRTEIRKHDRSHYTKRGYAQDHQQGHRTFSLSDDRSFRQSLSRWE